MKKLAALAAALALAGCSTIEGERTSPSTLIPPKQLNISPSFMPSAEGITAAAIAFWIIDPLAPNWKVKVVEDGENRYFLSATMKKFITGGEGEVGPVLRRAAEKLRREKGFGAYVVLEHSEGIESHVLVAQRVATQLIELR